MLYEIINKNILITDKDKILIYSGNSKERYLNKPISNELLKKIKDREQILSCGKIIINKNEEILKNYIFKTIIINGDEIGSILVFSENEFNQYEINIINTFQSFLQKHLEE